MRRRNSMDARIMHFKLNPTIVSENRLQPTDNVPVASVWINTNEKGNLTEIDAFLGMYKDFKTLEPDLSLTGNPTGRITKHPPLCGGSATTTVSLPIKKRNSRERSPPKYANRLPRRANSAPAEIKVINIDTEMTDCPSPQPERMALDFINN
mmetsp:Transcript_2533/g.2831  ORF Transcript_2533/g.2831 Transcript_2533/m.2831 type:complete len:152 (+) Transcript_2533:92-547(+)